MNLLWRFWSVWKKYSLSDRVLRERYCLFQELRINILERIWRPSVSIEFVRKQSKSSASHINNSKFWGCKFSSKTIKWTIQCALYLQIYADDSCTIKYVTADNMYQEKIQWMKWIFSFVHQKSHPSSAKKNKWAFVEKKSTLMVGFSWSPLIKLLQRYFICSRKSPRQLGFLAPKM